MTDDVVHVEDLLERIADKADEIDAVESEGADLLEFAQFLCVAVEVVAVDPEIGDVGWGQLPSVVNELIRFSVDGSSGLSV